MLKSICAIAAVTVASVLVLPTVSQARTDDRYEQLSVAVPYGDLDLTTKRGAEALDRRIASAARQICEIPGSRSLVSQSDFQECVKSVRDSSVGPVQLALRSARPRTAGA